MVAARLKERFERPAFAIAWNGGGLGAGSGRSIAGVDLGAAVRAAVEEGILVKGGGHAMAAGITLRARQARRAPGIPGGAARGRGAAASADRDLEIDGALTESGATPALVEDLERAGPYGNGNPAPVFAFPAHRVAFADTAGNGHVRLTLAAASGREPEGDRLPRRRHAARPRAACGARQAAACRGNAQLDHFGGSPRPQLRVLDAAEPAGGSRQAGAAKARVSAR